MSRPHKNPIRVHIKRCPLTGKVRYPTRDACLKDLRAGGLPYAYLCACEGWHRTRLDPASYDPNKQPRPQVRMQRYRYVRPLTLGEVARIKNGGR